MNLEHAAFVVGVAPASFREWPALLAMLHEAFAYQHDRIDPPSSLWRLDAAGLAAKADEETLFLASSPEGVVGCMFAARRRGALYIGKFAVSLAHQRSGIGRRLMTAAERHARALGLDTLTLDTRIELVENHAAFAAMGFAKAGEHAHAGHARATFISMHKPLTDRATELIARLQLAPHPEGGWYREVFRSADRVTPHDDRPSRSALTTIDFLLTRGQCSAWHRVRSDEVWHLLEGSALRLWLMRPSLDALQAVTLGAVDGSGVGPRHVVPAGWWQAAEPLGDFAYAGATVAPGFDFADFAFLRDDPVAREALTRLDPTLARLL